MPLYIEYNGRQLKMKLAFLFCMTMAVVLAAVIPLNQLYFVVLGDSTSDQVVPSQ